MLIPDLSFNYTRGIAHKKYTDTFAKIASTVPTDKSLPNKIYLSRTKLGYNETFGEKTIENIFAKNGFTIIYPEQLSLEKQIQLMKAAQTIAGVSGTALHLSLFAQNGIKLICIHKRNYILKMQILIDKLKNINGTYIDAFLTIGNLKKCDGKSSAALIGINKNLQNFFNDNNFIYSLDKNNNTKEYKQFIQSFNKQRRIIPKWLGGIILSFVPSHNLRHSLRKKWRLK
ncbi:MAG: glycosyltransferase 61 family protein [Alphaproteobacteria bacterium]